MLQTSLTSFFEMRGKGDNGGANCDMQKNSNILQRQHIANCKSGSCKIFLCISKRSR